MFPVEIEINIFLVRKHFSSILPYISTHTLVYNNKKHFTSILITLRKKKKRRNSKSCNSFTYFLSRKLKTK